LRAESTLQGNFVDEGEFEEVGRADDPDDFGQAQSNFIETIKLKARKTTAGIKDLNLDSFQPIERRRQ